MKKVIKKSLNKKTVCIIGLGYVGLPLLLAFHKKPFIKIIGIDNDESKINRLNKGKTYINDLDLRNINKKRVLFSSDVKKIINSDYIIICLPTPLTKKKYPDLSIVKRSIISMIPFLKVGQTIILESTTYPGTTKELILPILKKTGFKIGTDIFLAFSPERINPGSKTPIENIPKVVGADDKKSLSSAKNIYKLIFKRIYTTNSSAVAEATKLTENIFRSVNIALVNELKIIYNKMDIDIWEVIKLAKTKPFGYMPFYPGPGLGGHCIPIDPFYLTWKAKKHGIDTKFIKLSGKINSLMPKYVLRKIIDSSKKYLGIEFKKIKILLIGIAYKKNTNDLRESPSVEIIRLLEEKNIFVNYYDPFVSTIDEMRNYPFQSGKKGIPLNKKNIIKHDIIVIVTDHDKVNYKLIKSHSKIIIDTRNVIESKRFKGKLIKA